MFIKGVKRRHGILLLLFIISFCEFVSAKGGGGRGGGRGRGSSTGTRGRGGGGSGGGPSGWTVVSIIFGVILAILGCALCCGWMATVMEEKEPKAQEMYEVKIENDSTTPYLIKTSSSSAGANIHSTSSATTGESATTYSTHQFSNGQTSVITYNFTTRK